MPKNRREIFVKGLGNLEIREVDPSAGTDYSSVGFLGGTNLEDVYDMETVKDELGQLIDVKEKGQEFTIQSSLIQTTKSQLDILTGAKGKIHSIRYFGEDAGYYKFFGIDQCRIIPGANLDFKPGLRTVPFVAKSLNLAGELGYSAPLYHLIETRGPMFLSKLGLWLSPRNGENVGAPQLLDASGFARHGIITSDYGTIWQTGTPDRFNRLDGVNDAVDLGDILDDDGSADFSIEGWFRIQAANGTVQELLTKKSAITGNTAGFSLHRNASNQVVFTLASGSANVAVASAATLLQNVWNFVRASVDRNGNATVYVNGAVSGTPASVAALGTGTNALSYYIGRDGTNFGQFDFSDIRHFPYGAGALPANDAAIALAHYNAEKTIHGL